MPSTSDQSVYKDTDWMKRQGKAWTEYFKFETDPEKVSLFNTRLEAMKEASGLAASGDYGDLLLSRLNLANTSNATLSDKDRSLSLGPHITVEIAACAAEHLQLARFTLESFQTTIDVALEREGADHERMEAAQTALSKHREVDRHSLRGEALTRWEDEDKQLQEAVTQAKRAYEFSHECRVKLGWLEPM